MADAQDPREVYLVGAGFGPRVLGMFLVLIALAALHIAAVSGGSKSFASSTRWAVVVFAALAVLLVGWPALRLREHLLRSPAEGLVSLYLPRFVLVLCAAMLLSAFALALAEVSGGDPVGIGGVGWAGTGVAFVAVVLVVGVLAVVGSKWMSGPSREEMARARDTVLVGAREIQ